MRLHIQLLGPLVCMLSISTAIAANPDGSAPEDYAYRMQVTGSPGAAAYRVTLPLSLYQKVFHTDLSDLRVFNGSGEQVPFAFEQPTLETQANAATPLPLFPLVDDSSASLEALRVTIEAGKGAVNVEAGGQPSHGDRTATYLLDGRILETPVAALRLGWPEQAADFAGRIRVEASDSLADWRVVATAAPIANLHANQARLVEQRIEFPASKAKYWRLSWVGAPAPFVLTSASAEPPKQNVDARRDSLTLEVTQSSGKRGEFEYYVRPRVPVDRINLQLPEDNTVVQVELLSRPKLTVGWEQVRNCGFYRLQGDGTELRNGPIAIPVSTDSYWQVRTDPKRGGLGKVAPQLVVEWVPHQLVFVARGAAPFYVAYGSATADTPAAVSTTLLPPGISIVTASLSDPEPLGGDVKLQPPAEPYAWKAALLWVILIAAAGLLAWMAFRLSKDFKHP
jgi:hypothetical protein